MDIKDNFLLFIKYALIVILVVFFIFKERKNEMKIQHNLLRKKEFGRSMVEMLGVLAIIGVLSIGGIAGYRYAMTQHKLNQLFYDIEIERVAALEEMNKENPTSYVSETKNSGEFIMIPSCLRWSMALEKCFALKFYIKDPDVCEAFKKQAPDNWVLVHQNTPPFPIKQIMSCDNLPTEIMMGFSR